MKNTFQVNFYFEVIIVKFIKININTLSKLIYTNYDLNDIQSKIKITNELYNTYDNYIRKRYKIDINYQTLDEVKNRFN